MNENLDKPPVEEPAGYVSAAGFVKSRPENNDYYVEQFKDNSWYPIIKETHDRLTKLIPGYNIAQIKEKFGGLRYYIDFPEQITIPEDYYYAILKTEADVIKEANRIIECAEYWVFGYEAAIKEMNKNENN